MSSRRSLRPGLTHRLAEATGISKGFLSDVENNKRNIVFHTPLEIGTSEGSDLAERAREVLTLTKMNWNSADGIGRHPITVTFARRVGMIMTEMGEDVTPNPFYRFYM
jgi:argonaute-like protein implicated in RNA metabolism and viral defense